MGSIIGVIIIILALFLIVAIPITIIVLFVYGLVKKKKKLSIITSSALVVIALGVLFISSHSIDFRYNDWWVVGKTEEQIINRYGEFDVSEGTRRGYFLYKDNGMIMPDYLPHYYYIHFNNDGVADRVYEGVSKGA